MHEWFRVVPTYMLGGSIYCDTQCQGLSDSRKSPLAEGGPLEPEVWAMSNLTMDVIMMFVHMAVWSILILLIEVGLFRIFRINPNVKVLDEARNLDADVQAEETRLTDGGCHDIV